MNKSLFFVVQYAATVYIFEPLNKLPFPLQVKTSRMLDYVEAYEQKL